MRVIHATDYGSPYSGSYIPMLEAAHRMTLQQGWESLLVLPFRAQAREWVPAFRERHGSAVSFAPAGGYREKRRWLEALVSSAPGPTLLHSTFTDFDLPVSSLARSRNDTQAIWHFQTVLSDGLAARTRNRLRFTFASRYVERMLCVGPHLAAGLRARGAPPEKVLYFPNAVDTDRFPGPPSRDERISAKESFGIDPDATVLLHIGRDWLLKGGDLFLDAFELLDDLGPVGLMVRGGDEARREVARRGLDGRVMVVEGVSDVRRLHAACDLLLATSRGEGTLPWVVTEALSSGVGVVATDIPGHALPDGDPPGLRTARVEPHAIAAAARLLLERSPDDASAEAQRSHDWVRDTLGLEAWASRLRRVYESVVEDGRASGP